MQSASNEYPQCMQGGASNEYPQCMQGASNEYPQCMQCASNEYPQYMRGASNEYPQCMRGASNEHPQCMQGASNEYLQYMFSWRNKNNISTYQLKTAAYLEPCFSLRLWVYTLIFPTTHFCINHEQAHYKTCNKTCVTSKDSDQHIHPPSMAKVHVHSSLDSMEAVEGTWDQQRL